MHSVPSKTLTLQTDANQKAPGTVLLHDGHLINFVTKSMQPHQRTYVATELETLIVAWTMQKFHHFLFGKRYLLVKDHISLENELAKSGSNSTKTPGVINEMHIRAKHPDCLSRFGPLDIYT